MSERDTYMSCTVRCIQHLCGNERERKRVMRMIKERERERERETCVSVAERENSVSM